MLEGTEAAPMDSRGLPSQRLVTTLRKQLASANTTRASVRWIDRWKFRFGLRNRSVTLAIVSTLLILSLIFGMGSAYQVRQTEGGGSPIFALINGLFGLGGSNNGLGAPEETSMPEGALSMYGAQIGWPDRFKKVEVDRETMSNKALWPISTLISTLILGAWLLPRSKR